LLLNCKKKSLKQVSCFFCFLAAERCAADLQGEMQQILSAFAAEINAETCVAFAADLERFSRSREIQQISQTCRDAADLERFSRSLRHAEMQQISRDSADLSDMQRCSRSLSAADLSEMQGSEATHCDTLLCFSSLMKNWSAYQQRYKLHRKALISFAAVQCISPCSAVQCRDSLQSRAVLSSLRDWMHCKSLQNEIRKSLQLRERTARQNCRRYALLSRDAADLSDTLRFSRV
jgi:hypothetical protein